MGYVVDFARDEYGHKFEIYVKFIEDSVAMRQNGEIEEAGNTHNDAISICEKILCEVHPTTEGKPPRSDDA